MDKLAVAAKAGTVAAVAVVVWGVGGGDANAPFCPRVHGVSHTNHGGDAGYSLSTMNALGVEATNSSQYTPPWRQRGKPHERCHEAYELHPCNATPLLSHGKIAAVRRSRI